MSRLAQLAPRPVIADPSSPSPEISPTEPAVPLRDRIDALTDLSQTVIATLPALTEDIEAQRALRRSRELVEQAVGRLGVSNGHTVVAIVGATGGGKSSLFNVVSGLDLSQTSPLRPTTGE